MIRDAMDKAAEQSLRAGQIIRRLRDFVARGESERRIESVKKLIEEASALALVGAKEHGVRVRFQIDPAHDLVLADKVQIQQVLLNLIRNAIEAMEQSPRRELLIVDRLARRRTGGGQRRRHRPGHRAGDRRRSCSSRSSPPSARAWASACRSRAPSSRRHGGQIWRRAEPGRRHRVPLHLAQA